MIILANIEEVKELKQNGFQGNSIDEVWLVVQTVKKYGQQGKQVRSLAPSETLFRHYLSLKKRLQWSHTAFLEEFVPTYLRELKANKEAIASLNELYQISKTKNVIVACHCENEENCHRSIIGGLLEGVGVTVLSTSCHTSYRAFYDMYQKIAQSNI